VAMWAMIMASVIILYSVISGDIPSGMGSALSLLIGVIGGYIAADSFTKPKG
jgi:hypothetical protein